MILATCRTRAIRIPGCRSDVSSTVVRIVKADSVKRHVDTRHTSVLHALKRSLGHQVQSLSKFIMLNGSIQRQSSSLKTISWRSLRQALCPMTEDVFEDRSPHPTVARVDVKETPIPFRYRLATGRCRRECTREPLRRTGRRICICVPQRRRIYLFKTGN
jgi:hypothetical protein